MSMKEPLVRAVTRHVCIDQLKEKSVCCILRKKISQFKTQKHLHTLYTELLNRASIITLDFYILGVISWPTTHPQSGWAVLCPAACWLSTRHINLQTTVSTLSKLTPNKLELFEIIKGFIQCISILIQFVATEKSYISLLKCIAHNKCKTTAI